MRIKQFDLMLAVAISFLNLLWTVRQGHSLMIGMALALPMVFFLPGYTLIKVLFYRSRLEGVRRFLLCLALSMAIEILCGFVLNATPWGLRPFSWAICLSTLTTVFSLLAALLQKGQKRVSTGEIWLLWLRSDLGKHWKKRVAVTLGLLLALGMAVYSIQFSVNSVVHQRRSGFTQLWIVQADQVNHSCSVLIGIGSFEFTPVKYHIVMTVNGSQAKAWSSITLSPQRTWNTSVPVTSVATGNANVVVQLYRVDKPGIVYRDVHLTLRSLGGDRSGQGQQCTT